MSEPSTTAHGSKIDPADTLPKLLLQHARIRSNSPAMREKAFGIWQTWTWAEMADEVGKLVCGLKALGLESGDKLAVVGDNRPRLYWSMVAAQCIGAIPVPLYQDSVAAEMIYILNDADIRFAVVEDQEQVDKLLEIKDRCPKLENVVYDEIRGLRDYEHTGLLHSIADLQTLGQDYDRAHSDFFERCVAETQGDQFAIMLYTSGTTGNPKGVLLTHDNLVITGRNGVEQEGLTADEEVLAYLPMAWVGDNLFSVTQSYVAGFCVNCPESTETVMTDMREIGPTYYFAPPRVYENLLTQVIIRMEDASAVKRKVFDYFMEVARKVGSRILDGEQVNSMERMKYWIGNVLVYAPLKNVLGFSRIKLAFTAGEAIGPDIFDFYRSLGINVKQLYGQTEATVFICVQPNGQVRADTVGVPAAGVEVKISDDGEVLYRSPGVFHSYYKNEKSTRSTKTEDGWVLTGDAGYFDDEGHLRIIDRAKDVGKLTSGAMFAPKYLENKLKFFPQVKEVVAFGDGRDFAAVFVNIDLDAVGNWAERQNMAYTGYTDLAARPEVAEMVRECVEKVNADLAEDSRLSASQIRRFLILPKELDADDGELTRTRKVRRNFIADRYEDLVNGLYDGRSAVDVDLEVKFEDGRTGRLLAKVEIQTAQAYGVTEMRKTG
jgi:long-chain acyl-CoA synthetase